MPQASNVWEVPYVPVDDDEGPDDTADLAIPPRPIRTIAELADADLIARGHGEPVVSDLIRSAKVAAAGIRRAEDTRRMSIRSALAFMLGASSAIWGLIILAGWLVTTR